MYLFGIRHAIFTPGGTLMKCTYVAMGAIAAALWVAPAFAADAAAGKEVYSKKCVSCHAANGEPKDAVAKMLKVEMRPLGSKEVQAKTDAELKKIILEGMGKMKPVSGVDAKAADNLVAYLRTLKQN